MPISHAKLSCRSLRSLSIYSTVRGDHCVGDMPSCIDS